MLDILVAQVAGSHQARGTYSAHSTGQLMFGCELPLTEKACTLFGGPDERINLPACINERPP